MYLSLNWIKQFVDVPADKSATEISELLTLHTAEIEGYEDEKAKFTNMAVGKVVEIKPHPGADKLVLVDTDIGGNTIQQVCGGQNLKKGMLVAVALPGSMVKWHGEGELVEIKEAKVRGETSCGMICAGEEIDLPADNVDGQKEVRIHDLSYSDSKPGTPLAEALGRDDVIFEVDNKSLTHRPDLWGHFGFARELSAIFDIPRKKIDALFKNNLKCEEKSQKLTVEIQDKEICPRFSGCIVKNVKITESPQWIQSRLRAVGIRPINNVVDITNFVMVEFGQPMHVYDRKIVKDDTLIVRFAKEGEILETIDHKKRKLTEQDPVVANKKGIIGLAGIMGGVNSEINDKTNEVIFEAANWDPVVVRKSSTHHGLRSDASQRFEKGLDPELTEWAVNRALALLQESCPDAIVISPLQTVGGWKPKKIEIDLDVKATCKKIGVEISSKEMIRILKGLEFGVSPASPTALRHSEATRRQELRGASNKLKVSVMPHRATGDVEIEDDLVEEIARIYGYENIPAILPDLPITMPRENRVRDLENRARNILSRDLNMYEAQSYSFYGDKELESALVPKELHLEMLNPLSEDQKYMRVSLVPPLLRAVHENLKHHAGFSIYEIGRTYIDEGNYFPNEEAFICGLIVTSQKSDDEVFHAALGHAQEFFMRFNAGKSRVQEAQSIAPYAHPKKCAEVRIRKDAVASVYELHPAVLKNFAIDAKVAAFEINLSKLIEMDINARAFRPIPRFPGIELDISVLVEERTPVHEIQELIKKSDNQLLKSVKLIDIFQGRQLGKGKKSLTFRVLLQSEERTLTDEEMQSVQRKIHEALTSAGFAIR